MLPSAIVLFHLLASAMRGIVIGTSETVVYCWCDDELTRSFTAHITDDAKVSEPKNKIVLLKNTTTNTFFHDQAEGTSLRDVVQQKLLIVLNSNVRSVGEAV